MKYNVGISTGRDRRRSSRYSSKASSRGSTTSRYRKVRKYAPRKQKGIFSRFKGSSTKQTKFKKAASRVLGIFLGIGIISVLLGTIYVGATLASISASLPDPDELVERRSAQSTKIYDSGGPDEGVLLYTIYGDQNREFVELDKIPEHTKWAFLAAEDAEFYDHKGLDLPGLVKAGYNYVLRRSTSRGASTISQQLVKNTLLYDFLGDEAYEKTVTRKVKEMLITMQLEQSFSKDEILQMYLNEVALGGTNYGIQAAAKAYFGKNASELTLAESAMLAGLIQAPGAYSPLFGSQPDQAPVRQEYVLDQMLAKKDLINKTSKRLGVEFEVSDDLIEEAKAEEIVYDPARIDIKAPHFVFYVKQQLIDDYGIDRVERGGLTVTTSLDYDLQQIAEEEITAGVDRFRAAYNVNNGSMVVIDPKTGQLLAMVGSYDYWADPDPRVDGNVNVATALRQMGSSVKPYTYLTAFNQGYSPALLTPDIPLDFGYKTKNWDNKYKGLMLARQALIESRNIPALYTMDLIGGPGQFINTAEKLGITTLTETDRYGLSLTLGAGEMKLLEHAAAFGVFANGGVKNPTTPILKVETYDGEILEEWEPENGKRVWDEKEIYLLNWVICDLGGQGRIFSQNYVVGDQRLCGKTGTTDGPRDLTTILYYPNLVVGVWTGNNNNEETIGVSGQGWSTTVPLPIAHSFMSRVIGKFGSAWYSRPAGIVTGAVCRDTGQLATNETKCDKLSSVFIQGKLPPVDNGHVEKPVCKETGKIATNEDDANALGLIEYKTYLEIILPLQKHQAKLNAWLSASDTYGDISNLPEEAECPLHLGPGNAPVIEITQPENGISYETGQEMQVTVSTTSLPGVKNVKYYIDGSLIGTVTTAPYSLRYPLPGTLSPGSHTLEAKVTDEANKTGSDSINFSITSTVSITLTQPSEGDTLTSGGTYQLRATVSGNTSSITGVNFFVAGVPPITALDLGGNLWGANWTVGVPPGEYEIYAVATVSGGDTYQSARITIEVV